mgnify:CR=1 FL=1
MINYYEEVFIDIAPVSRPLHGVCFRELGYSMGGARRDDSKMVFYLAFCGIRSYVFSGLFGG